MTPTRHRAPQLIVLEASGGWEPLIAATLAAAGLPVEVLDRRPGPPSRTIGRLAPDALDTQMLARCAEMVRPTPRPLSDAAQQALSVLLTRRRQVLGRLSAERQRLDTAQAAVRSRMQAHLRWLQQAGMHAPGSGVTRPPHIGESTARSPECAARPHVG